MCDLNNVNLIVDILEKKQVKGNTGLQFVKAYIKGPRYHTLTNIKCTYATCVPYDTQESEMLFKVLRYNSNNAFIDFEELVNPFVSCSVYSMICDNYIQNDNVKNIIYLVLDLTKRKLHSMYLSHVDCDIYHLGINNITKLYRYFINNLYDRTIVDSFEYAEKLNDIHNNVNKFKSNLIITNDDPCKFLGNRIELYALEMFSAEEETNLQEITMHEIASLIAHAKDTYNEVNSFTMFVESNVPMILPVNNFLQILFDKNREMQMYLNTVKIEKITEELKELTCSSKSIKEKLEEQAEETKLLKRTVEILECNCKHLREGNLNLKKTIEEEYEEYIEQLIISHNEALKIKNDEIFRLQFQTLQQ